ncbi:MAG TPA: serine protease [Gemmata sp.]|nr:serine protease [Gemmata sp.]
MSRILLILSCTIALSLLLAAQQPRQIESPSAATVPDLPAFVDDEKFFDDLMDKITDLAKDGKCLAHDKLLAKLNSGKPVKLSPGKPADRALSPEEVYKRALPSVFVIGSVYKDKDGDWQDGLYATAWVVGSDGVLVTNWHVFEDLEKDEVFGAMDHKGNIYPVIDFLGGDKVADVAIFRIDAKNLSPLPIAESFAEIGSWVGVLSHPGDNFYVFTTGAVTRYSTNKNDKGHRERWMGVTAEYAGGSSGAPILNKYGAVAGMAALTLTLDDGKGAVNPATKRRMILGQPPQMRQGKAKRQPPVAPPPREKPDPNAPQKPAPASVQMIIKMGVPGPTIRRSFSK